MSHILALNSSSKPCSIFRLELVCRTWLYGVIDTWLQLRASVHYRTYRVQRNSTRNEADETSKLLKYLLRILSRQRLFILGLTEEYFALSPGLLELYCCLYPTICTLPCAHKRIITRTAPLYVLNGWMSDFLNPCRLINAKKTTKRPGLIIH